MTVLTIRQRNNLLKKIERLHITELRYILTRLSENKLNDVLKQSKDIIKGREYMEGI